MKRLTFILVSLCLTLAAFAQDADSAYRTFCQTIKEKNIEGVSATVLGKAMLKMMGEKGSMGIPESGSVNMQNFFDKIESLEVLNAPDETIAKRLRPTLEKMLNADGYETLIDVMNDESHTVILIKRHSDTLREIVTISDERKQINVVDFLGNITFDDLQNSGF